MLRQSTRSLFARLPHRRQVTLSPAPQPAPPNRQFRVHWTLLGGAAVGTSLLLYSYQRSVPYPSTLSPQPVSPDAGPVETLASPPTSASLRERLRRTFRLCWRASVLWLLFCPAVITYPVSYLSDSFRDWWFHFLLSTAERGGAILIKASQWASTRPDLFGEPFCNVFRRLQDSTAPHAWAATEQTLASDLGPDWQSRLQVEPKPIGSGCIAQVYRGKVTVPGGGKWAQPVAVKVLHPGVRDNLEADFDLLRAFAWVLCRLPFGYGEHMKWMNAQGMVEEFGNLLEGQLDLREEAANLVRFNFNFRDSRLVRFPRSIKGFTDQASPNVLIEEFVEGKPVMQWASEHEGEKVLRETVCNRGIRGICKMIFQDNFLHGDLHPGNILITHKNEIVFLDVGIAKAFAPRDHDLLVSVLTCFVQANGRKAAAYMADNSDHRLGLQSRPEDVELFADKIEAMVVKAKTDESFFDSLGGYFSTICNAASAHRVKMNQGFVTMALAVKVIEGIALELNPEVEMWAIAAPMLTKAARRKWERVFDAIASIDTLMEAPV